MELPDPMEVQLIILSTPRDWENKSLVKIAGRLASSLERHSCGIEESRNQSLENYFTINQIEVTGRSKSCTRNWNRANYSFDRDSLAVLNDY